MKAVAWILVVALVVTPFSELNAGVFGVYAPTLNNIYHPSSILPAGATYTRSQNEPTPTTGQYIYEISVRESGVQKAAATGTTSGMYPATDVYWLGPSPYQITNINPAAYPYQQPNNVWAPTSTNWDITFLVRDPAYAPWIGSKSQNIIIIP